MHSFWCSKCENNACIVLHIYVISAKPESGWNRDDVATWTLYPQSIYPSYGMGYLHKQWLLISKATRKPVLVTAILRVYGAIRSTRTCPVNRPVSKFRIWTRLSDSLWTRRYPLLVATTAPGWASLSEDLNSFWYSPVPLKIWTRLFFASVTKTVSLGSMKM